MNTYARSIELDALAAKILTEMGLEYETDHLKLRPAVMRLRSISDISLSTARTVIARHLRKIRGLIVRSDGNLYRVTNISTFPHPDGAEEVPVVLVRKME